MHYIDDERAFDSTRPERSVPETPSAGERHFAAVSLVAMRARRGVARMATTARVFAVLFTVVTVVRGVVGATPASLSRQEIRELRDEVRDMFEETMEMYLDRAFPADEIKPMSCESQNTMADGGGGPGMGLTLVDALDTIAVMGNKTMFERGVRLVIDHVRVDLDAHVSVFETNIRILGGLLSAHLLASDPKTGFAIDWYQSELLELALDLGEAFLPAFDTPTGVPYGAINLLRGVAPDETPIASTAAGGTMILEFGMLSDLTGDQRFRRAAEKALEGLWSRRSELNLVGTHLNVGTGDWTQAESSVGAGVDSFYEYLLKSYMLFGNERHLEIFEEAYAAVEAHVRIAPWYVEAGMMTGQIISSRYDSLVSFWPGLQAMYGDIEAAATTQDAFFQVWKHYGFTPEGFDVRTGAAIPGQKPYPLRPELIESTYLLYKATGDVTYISCGRDFIASLRLLKTKCGYAHMGDVSTQELEDKMESFFLAETLKYLYLLFDAALDRENIVDGGPYPYMFTTEAHIFPIKPGIRAKDEYGEYDAPKRVNKEKSFLRLGSAFPRSLRRTRHVKRAAERAALARRRIAVMSDADGQRSAHKANKYCNYHSLLWQMGLARAPERPHNLTERLQAVTGQPNGIRTLVNSVQEFFKRLNSLDQSMQVRFGIGSLARDADDATLKRRFGYMIERLNDAIGEASRGTGATYCVTLDEFSIVTENDIESVDLKFKTKIEFEAAGKCVSEAVHNVMGLMMHAFAFEANMTYDCAVSETTYLPKTMFDAFGDDDDDDDDVTATEADTGNESVEDESAQS